MSQKCIVNKNGTLRPLRPQVPGHILTLLLEGDQMTDEDGHNGHDEANGEQGRGTQLKPLHTKHHLEDS